MKIDIEKLKENLNNLRGLDMELCVQQEKAAGNTNIFLRGDERFQSRLAAHALKIPVAEIRELPLSEYLKIVQEVFSFLMPVDSKTSDSSEV